MKNIQNNSRISCVIIFLIILQSGCKSKKISDQIEPSQSKEIEVIPVDGIITNSQISPDQIFVANKELSEKLELSGEYKKLSISDAESELAESKNNLVFVTSQNSAQMNLTGRDKDGTMNASAVVAALVVGAALGAVVWKVATRTKVSDSAIPSPSGKDSLLKKEKHLSQTPPDSGYKNSLTATYSDSQNIRFEVSRGVKSKKLFALKKIGSDGEVPVLRPTDLLLTQKEIQMFKGFQSKTHGPPPFGGRTDRFVMNQGQRAYYIQDTSFYNTKGKKGIGISFDLNSPNPQIWINSKPMPRDFSLMSPSDKILLGKARSMISEAKLIKHLEDINAIGHPHKSIPFHTDGHYKLNIGGSFGDAYVAKTTYKGEEILFIQDTVAWNGQTGGKSLSVNLKSGEVRVDGKVTPLTQQDSAFAKKVKEALFQQNDSFVSTTERARARGRGTITESPRTAKSNIVQEMEDFDARAKMYAPKNLDDLPGILYQGSAQLACRDIYLNFTKKAKPPTLESNYVVFKFDGNGVGKNTVEETFDKWSELQGRAKKEIIYEPCVGKSLQCTVRIPAELYTQIVNLGGNRYTRRFMGY